MMILYFSENEFDGFALLELTKSDLQLMLPRKVGVVRKLTVLLEV